METVGILQKIKYLVLRLTLLVFLLCVLLILFYGITDAGIDAEWFWSANPLMRVVCLCPAILFFLGLFQFGWQRLEEKKELQKRMITLAVFILLFVLQLLVLFCARPLLRHDALKVFDEALSMLKTGGVTPGHFDDYFLRYTNNYGMLIFTYSLLRLSELTGLLGIDPTGGMLFMQVVNVIAIDASLYIGLLFLRRLYSASYEKAYLLMVLLCPFSYVWGAFYYTNTIAMPFYMLMLYLATLSMRQERWPVVRTLLIGFLAGAGFFLRATQGIMVIAILLYLLFRKVSFAGKMREIKAVLLLALGLVLAVVGYRILEKKYVHFDYSDSAFPAVHWVMMSLAGDGDFNQRDEMYTRSFPTAQEKKDADMELLKSRLDELGSGGLIRQCIKKMKLTFADGTGNYPAELAMSDNYGKAFAFVYGTRRGLLLYLFEGCYLAMMLLAFLGGCRLLMEERIGEIYVFLISLTGGFLFHMLWEAGSIYSIGFMPLLYVSAAYGMELFGRRARDFMYVGALGEKKRKPAAVPCFAVFAAGSLVTLLVSVKSVNTANGNDYSMNQFMFTFGDYVNCDEDTLLTQSFETEKGFGTIELMVHNPDGEANDSRYALSLYDEAGQLLDTKNINGADCPDLVYQRLDYAGNLPQALEENSADAALEKLPGGKYRLEIKKLAGANNLEFPYYGTGNVDLYTGGELGGAGLKKADLTMKIY